MPGPASHREHEAFCPSLFLSDRGGLGASGRNGHQLPVNSIVPDSPRAQHEKKGQSKRGYMYETPARKERCSEGDPHRYHHWQNKSHRPEESEQAQESTGERRYRELVGYGALPDCEYSERKHQS